MLSQSSSSKSIYLGQLWRSLCRNFYDDNTQLGASSLAFYMFLSLFPAMIFLLGLLPYLPIQNLEQQILDSLHEVLPLKSADTFTMVVREVTAHKKEAPLSFGLFFTLWSGSSGFYALMQQLNVIHQVKERRPFWKVRLLAMALMILFTILVALTFVLIIVWKILKTWLMLYVHLPHFLYPLIQVTMWPIIIFFLLLVMALLYTYGPNKACRFRYFSPGGIFATIAFIITSLLFRIYVDNFANYAATYGGLGAVIALLMWLYLIGLMALIGAQINKAIDQYRAHPAPPAAQ